MGLFFSQAILCHIFFCQNFQNIICNNINILQWQGNAKIFKKFRVFIKKAVCSCCRNMSSIAKCSLCKSYSMISSRLIPHIWSNPKSELSSQNEFKKKKKENFSSTQKFGI